MTILLVDTNISALPIFEALTKKFKVVCIGNNEYDFMPRYGVDYAKVDYSKQRDLQLYIKKNKFISIIPGCNDVSYETCSKMKHPLLEERIDPFQTINTIHNKKEFRQLAIKLNMSVPRVIHEFKGKEFPIIVKPTDSFSGKGVTRIQKPTQALLKNAIKNAVINSRTNSFIVEEFIEGQLYSYSCFLKNQRVQEEFFVEEISTANPFVVDLSRVKFDLPKKVRQKMKSDIETMASYLCLRDGLVHVQFIVRNEVPYIIEITRRCPGDLYSSLIEKATGFPYAGTYAATFMLEKNTYRRKRHNPLSVRYTLSDPKKITFRSIKIREKIEVDEIFILEKSGQRLEASPKGRIAVAFFSPKRKNIQNKIIDSLKKRKFLPFTVK